MISIITVAVVSSDAGYSRLVPVIGQRHRKNARVTAATPAGSCPLLNVAVGGIRYSPQESARCAVGALPRCRVPSQRTDAFRAKGFVPPQDRSVDASTPILRKCAGDTFKLWNCLAS